jgi:hypothetical protein
LKGAQGAGFMNLNKGDVYGAVGSGFMNVNCKQVTGLQVAGFMNICGDTLKGLTGAGFMNYTSYSKRAVEISGFMNQAKRSNNNIQLAGFMNQSFDGTTKFQGAGFLNQARTVTGTQIGFINICDSIKGVPLGFISIVKSGLHQVEIFGDETFYTNLAFRTGVNAFHNILFAGIQPSGNQLWYFGYGIETSPRLTEKVRVDISLSAQHVSKNQFYSATSELLKGYLGANIKLAKKIHLAFGPTLNFYITDALSPEYSTTYSSVAPYSQYSNLTRNDFDIKGWIGGRVALRFF